MQPHSLKLKWNLFNEATLKIFKALANLDPELLDIDEYKLAVEYEDSGLPVKFLLFANVGDISDL